MTHKELMDASVNYLSSSSLFFKRFDGADHFLMCAWWGCNTGLGPKHRTVLRRTVIGINERVYWWTRCARWGLDISLVLGGNTSYMPYILP